MSTNSVSVPRTALSPVSVAGSEWSGISKYQSGELYGAGPQRTNSGGMLGGNGNSNGGGGNPRTVSPPASIARSSDGAGLYAQSETSSLKGIIQEEEVAVHHSALKKLLQPYLAQQQLSGRPNKARDKLLRLSVIQFQELSTDVYDELQRREANALPETIDKPPHLLPKDKFHPKRNQARQKLSTLAMERFRDLATDVYYELERRFPQFGDGSGSPTAAIMSLNGLPPNRVGSPGPGRSGSPGPGMMAPGRVGSPGPGRVGSPGPRHGPPPGGYAAYNGGGGGTPRMGSPGMPPRNGPMSPQGAFGRPLPKTYQAGNLIPNKSTMVEDDDDGLGDDSDHEGAFGLEDRRSNGMNGRNGMKRDSNRSMSSLRNGIGPGGERINPEYKSKIEALQDKVASLEGRLDDRNREISELKSGERRRESNINTELDGKLIEAQNLNKSLQEEISRLKEGGAGGGGGDKNYNDLLKEHEQLKAELREQEEVTEEVRREAMEFLNQMKSISERADNFYEKEERMHADYQKLQEEVKEWKARYARVKAALRNLRTSSIGLNTPAPANMTTGFSDPNGLVKDMHITKFQIAIDELLRTARGVNCVQTLEFVKGVVMATRSIMEDVEDAQNEERVKLKARVSATANNLTTAAKNHALSQGLSPVSLVDAAASHLCQSVVELIKVVKVRTSVGGEIDGEDDGEDEIRSPDSPTSGGGMFGGRLHPENGKQQQQQQQSQQNQQVQNENTNGVSPPPQQELPPPPPQIHQQPPQNRLSGDSVYSPIASPRSSQGGDDTDALQFPPQDAKGRNGSVGGRGGGAWGDIAPSLAGVGSPPRNQPTIQPIHIPDSNVEELRISLETQTEGIVENIQHLLSSIRAGEDMSTLRGHVAQIAGVVDKVVKNTEEAMEMSGNEKLRERGDWIVSNLAGCAAKMRAATGGDAPGEGVADKEFRGGLAALAFDLARETKDLVRTVEEISDESRRPGGISVDDLR